MSFVLLHGFLGGPAIWRPVVLGAGIDDRAQCLVLPGHGPEPRPFRKPAHERARERSRGCVWKASDYAGLETGCVSPFDDAVDGIAARLPEGPPRILVGYSMGARVGLRLLLRHPDRFSGAILIGLHPGLRSNAEREARLAWERGERAFLCDRGLEAFVARWEKLPILRPARPLPDLVLERRRRIRLGHTVTGIAEAIDVLGLGSMPSSWDAIGELRIPVHLMAGAADEKFCTIGEETRLRNAAFSFEAVPGAAHDLVHEAPAAVIRALQRGLS